MAANLNHRVEGLGPAVLLLHAGVADLGMWDAQVAELERDHMVVRCDLRGFGGSPLAPAASYSDAEDVLALVDELGLRDFALVGSSYGGFVALQLASAAPARVRRLVLVDPLAELAEPDEVLREVWQEEERLVEAGDLDGAADLMVSSWLGPEADPDARELVRAAQRNTLAQQVAAGEVDARELPVKLETLAMPTTVFVGLHDKAFFVEVAHQLVRRLPDARLVELPWAGHLPSLERPAETARLVRDALSG